MKKAVMAILLCFVLIGFLACGTSKDNPSEDEPSNPDITNQDAEEPTDNYEIITVKDLYPINIDNKYSYAGVGNEFASYTVFTDYIDKNNKRVQIRTNNGGTETIEVIEITNGKLSILLSKSEVYYRDNLLTSSELQMDFEVLLMEPIKKGTQWKLSDNRVRTITSTDIDINTPLGDYKGIEVTTEGFNGTTKDYYVKNIGLVKSVFNSEDIEVTSTLNEVKENTPLTIPVTVYYPNKFGNILTVENSLSLHTNDISRIVIQDLLRENPSQDTLAPLISNNTKVNTLYLGKDNIAYIDFSKELITEMNAGSSYESLILQSIVNTIGDYYRVERVYLTVDSNPYESGHILLKKGELFKVNMDMVIR